MNRDPAAWARLGEAIRDARQSLGKERREFAEMAGVSLASLKKLEDGHVPEQRMPITMRPVREALGWPVGAPERILDGGPPPEIEGAEPEDGGRQQVPAQVDAETIKSVIATAMVRATNNVTTNEIRAAADIAVDELRRLGLVV